MHFSSPYLIVMNKSERITDTSLLPYDSIPVSAKENMGLDALKKEILRRFQAEFIFCELYVPYEKTAEYTALKPFITERKTEYTDEGQKINAVIPAHYIDKLNKFIIKTVNPEL